LWFCWKFINVVNYWELNSLRKKPDGRTSWSPPRIQTNDNQSAVIEQQLTYQPVDEEAAVILREHRRIDISAPDAQDAYHLDWTLSFTAGDQAVVLDRTPPQEQSWGGYAGLSLRFPTNLTARQAVSSQSLVEFGAGGRHRSRASAMDYHGLIEGHAAGVAFLDHPDNPRHPTPWYLIDSPEMSYMNAALLADAPLSLPAGGHLTLRYRVIVHPGRWDGARLQEAHTKFVRERPAPRPE